MSPVRAPLNTLLGLLLARWLLACTQRLLTHLTLPRPEVQNLAEEVEGEFPVSTPWHSRASLSLRRYSQRQRARYVRWRETDTAELAGQLRAQCDSLRDGVVTAPQVAADVSRKSNVSNPDDWIDKVRRRGARFVAPSTSSLQSAVTAASNVQTEAPLMTDPPATSEPVPGALHATDPPAPGKSGPGAPTETQVTRAAELSVTRTATLQEKPTPPGVSYQVRRSNRRPTVIPVASEPRFNQASTSQRAQPMAPAIRSPIQSPNQSPNQSPTQSPTQSIETQPLADTTRGPETFARNGSASTAQPTTRDTATAHSLPPLQKPASATLDNWPSLPEQSSRAVSKPANQGVAHYADEAVTPRWPSLPEFNVAAEPRPATASRRMARLEAEQSGTLWNV